MLVGSRAYWPKTTNVSKKQSPQNCCRDIDTKAMIFCFPFWQVTKAGFTISSLKRNGRIWNGTFCILHQKWRQRQCHQLRRRWAKPCGMQRAWFWPNSWNLGKTSLLLFMSRHCTSSVVRSAINVQDERPSSCMTPLAPRRTPTWEAIAKMGWEVLPHSSYCSDLAASDYHILGFVNDNIMRQQRQFRSSASVSSDCWNGILPKGNFQIPRTLGEMGTKKWRLCGKIKKGL